MSKVIAEALEILNHELDAEYDSYGRESPTADVLEDAIADLENNRGGDEEWVDSLERQLYESTQDDGPYGDTDFCEHIAGEMRRVFRIYTD